MDFIITFYWGQGLRLVGHRVQFAIDQLRQDTPHCVLGAVSLHPEGGIILGDCQDQFITKTLLQCFEGTLLFGTSFPGLFPG